MLGLVLSGGGAKGAFEVGVLKAIVERNRLYDPPILSGTSVGALNAAFLAQYPQGKFAEGVFDLEKLWLSLRGDKDVYKKRWFRYLRAALEEDSWFGLRDVGLYTSRPLWKLVWKHLSPEKVATSGRSLAVTACSVTTWQLKTWTHEDHEVIRPAVMGSAAFPGYLPLIDLDGDRFTDGGVREIAPVAAALEIGATKLDVILASPREAVRVDNNLSVLEFAWMVVDILSAEVKKGDLKALEGVPHRLFEPKEEVLKDSLDFDPVKINRSIQLGYELANEVLQ